MTASVRAAPLPGELLTELLSLVKEISAVLEPEQLWPTIARQIRRIVEYRVLDIFLPDSHGTLRAAYVDGDESAAAWSLVLAPGQGIVGTAAALREPVFVPEVSRDPRYLAISPGVVAELALPLVHHDRLVGVLNVEGASALAFSEDARTALRVLAGHLAAAVENATLYRETRWYTGLLATLYEIGQETATILDLDELLHRAAEIVKRVIDYETFGILLLDETGQELVLRKAVHYGTHAEKARIKLGQGLCGVAALTRQPLLVGDVLNDPRYLRLVPETRSELVVPLVHKDRLIGVFDLESSQLNGFNEQHLKILTPLAAQIAGAIENARLVDELKRRDRRVKEELAIASQVQHGLFPEECPSGPHWQAAAQFRPARELGGDLYDFFEVDPRTLGVALGDVAGKGVPAALYGAFASGSVRARAFRRHSPAALLERVNRTLNRRGVEGLFCTLSYALFDFERGHLQIGNSGLPYPLLYRSREGRCAPLKVAGLPLGAFEDSTYDELTVEVGQGDVLVLHSDGLSEAYNGRESYGTARLLEQVSRGAQGTASQLAEAVLLDLDAFMAGALPTDDVTLVVVKLQ